MNEARAQVFNPFSNQQQWFLELLWSTSIPVIWDLSLEISEEAEKCKTITNTSGVARTTQPICDPKVDLLTQYLRLKRQLEIPRNMEIMTKNSRAWAYGKGRRVSNSDIEGDFLHFLV